MKILVANDERHLSRLIQVNLERQGHTVLTAQNGADALRLAHSEIPDLAVLDTEMPPPAGKELETILKSEPKLAHIQIVLMGPNGDFQLDQ